MSKSGEAYIKSRERRALDIAFATSVGLLGSPVAAVAAAAVCLERGTLNPFFTQHRVDGEDGLFTIVKFHSIDRRYGQDPDQTTTFGSHDPRATRIGKILRRTGIDEYPQVGNILAGQMSAVGIRPQIVKVMTERKLATDPHHHPELLVHFSDIYGDYPDLFGYWRHYYSLRNGVNGAGQTLAHQMGTYAEDDPEAIVKIINADVMAEENASLENDLKSIVATPLDLVYHALLGGLLNTEDAVLPSFDR